eukprot:2533942-Ditylum_brightwellii.AAC.1
MLPWPLVGSLVVSALVGKYCSFAIGREGLRSVVGFPPGGRSMEVMIVFLGAKLDWVGGYWISNCIGSLGNKDLGILVGGALNLGC